MRNNYLKIVKVLFIAVLLVIAITAIKLRFINELTGILGDPFVELITKLNEVGGIDYYPGKEVVAALLGFFTISGLLVSIAIYFFFLICGFYGTLFLLIECIIVAIARALDTSENKAKWKEVIAKLLLLIVAIAHVLAILVYAVAIKAFLFEFILFVLTFIICMYIYTKGKKEENNMGSSEVIEEENVEKIEEDAQK